MYTNAVQTFVQETFSRAGVLALAVPYRITGRGVRDVSGVASLSHDTVRRWTEARG